MAALLKGGADPNAASGADVAPLEIAAQEGDIKAVELLVKAGAKIDFLSSETKRTALTAAAQKNHPEVIELLLAHKANVNQKQQEGETALMAAAVSGPDTVAALLRGGADVNAASAEAPRRLHLRRRRGMSPPSNCSSRRGPMSMRWQRRIMGVPCSRRPHPNFPNVVRVLLAAGADPETPSAGGHTPLEVARIAGDAECVKLIEVAMAQRHAATKPAKP